MVSIIIPEYKDDLYLIRCLNSIRRQNYKDTEILLINGRCGTAIIDKYNLKIVETNNVEDNGLNKAIVAAKGEYILFCNVSTILASNTLTELMKDVDNAFTYVNGYVLKEEEFQSRKDFIGGIFLTIFDLFVMILKGIPSVMKTLKSLLQKCILSRQWNDLKG